MSTDDFSIDLASGQITQDGVRYLLIRPDVIMGIGRYLDSPAALVAAMEESAYSNARDSFERYKASGMFTDGDALQTSCAIAARLGWGIWQAHSDPSGDTILQVHNSPFAAGVGSSELAVCGSIVGVLRAIFITAHDEHVTVQETQCSAQGHDFCSFRVRR